MSCSQIWNKMHGSFVFKGLINIFFSWNRWLFSCLMCSKPIFSHKFLRKVKIVQSCFNCRKLLQMPKVAQKLPSTFEPTPHPWNFRVKGGVHTCGNICWCAPQGRRVSLQTKASGQGQGKRRRSQSSSVWDLQSSLEEEFGIKDNVVYR